MGKQYKLLKDSDKEFIKNQKLFYMASTSGNEVNLSPKGYDTIRVLSDSTLVFLDYPGSGNRTHFDTINDGDFTLLFNSFDEKPMILRLFCKAKIVQRNTKDFENFLEMFDEEESLIRNFFIFDIYGVESSCGESIPYMEYKGDRNSLKKWAKKMDTNNKLEAYIQTHATPPKMKDI